MIPMTGLADMIEPIVQDQPGLDKREIATILREQEFPISLSGVNSVLYGHPDRFQWQPGGGERRAWYPTQRQSMTAIHAQQSALDDMLRILRERRAPDHFIESLYPWQQRALTEWQRCNSRGVVEAVTGGGKTRLALAAAALELHAGGRVLIIVHTKGLVDQWVQQIEQHLSSAVGRPLRIGRFDGSDHGNLSVDDIVVATVHMAYRYLCFPESLARGLLIADECHHYAAETWSRALETGFTARLGLTATYEREDNGIEAVLDPYFGGKCYSLAYEEALADDVIARFKIAFVGVPFSPDERLEYDEASERLSRYRRKLVNEYDVPEGTFGDFMKEVARLGKSGEEGAAKLAGFYLSAFNKRRKILAGAKEKLARLQGLAPAVKRAERAILFSQTKEAATAAIDALCTGGVNGTVLHSDMDMDDRRMVFAAFESGRHEIVAAPKLLDEGIDVPAADLAIILATSRSRRQMIQRRGRVIRKKADGRLARIAVLFIEGTCEDPSSGAHEDFIDMIKDDAEEVRTFRAAEPDVDVVQYLNQWWDS